MASQPVIQYTGPWTKCSVKYLEKIGSSYVLLKVEKPTSYVQEPGQYTFIEWSHSPKKPVRPYSIASAPESPDLEFCLVTSGRDHEVQKALETLTIGAAIQIGHATGNLKWPHPYGPIIFVAGGSGIAPIRSLLHHHLNTNGFCPVPTTLVFGVREGSAIPYHSEWLTWAQDTKTRFRYCLVAEYPTEGNQQKGRVTDILPQEITSGAHYLLCGPPAMVDACENTLIQHGVAPQNILMERY